MGMHSEHEDVVYGKHGVIPPYQQVTQAEIDEYWRKRESCKYAETGNASDCYCEWDDEEKPKRSGYIRLVPDGSEPDDDGESFL